MRMLYDEMHGNNSLMILGILYKTSWYFLSVIISLSTFLMQQQNSEYYDIFLIYIYKIKAYHICCCCKQIFIDAGQENERRMSEETQRKTRTIEDTATATIKQKHSMYNSGEISIYTADQNEIMSTKL